MNKVSKGERLLAALAANPNCELTPEGATYVKQRFDPYHDKPFRAVGYPDNYNGHTIARCIKKSISFTATSGDGSTPSGPWNFHIIQTPILTPVQLLATKVDNATNQFYWNGSQNLSKPWGGLMIIRSDTSSFTYPVPSVGAGSTNLLGQIQLTQEDMSDLMRVTSIGFELIDGTAELYRQGTLTSYRQNEPQANHQYMNGIMNENVPANTINLYQTSGRIFRYPPEDTDQAMVIPDTKQWKVAEGAYVDVDFNSQDIPMANPEYIAPFMADYTQDITPYNTDDAHTHVGWGGTPFTYSIATTTPTVVNHNKCPGMKYAPINQTGLMASGVSPQGQWTLNAIYYVECAPSGEDGELLTLASQSPRLDMFALMMIARLRQDSPIAVKLRENYLGEWFFNGISDIVKRVSPWLKNIQTIGTQVVDWVDSANNNGGMINPQTYVRGDVSKKVASEKKKQRKAKAPPPPPPGPPPRRTAFKPRPVAAASNPAYIAANKKRIRKRIAQAQAQGKYRGA